VTLPLRIRLAVIYSAILILVVGALEIAGYFAVRTAMNSLVDRELETRLAGVDDHLTRHLDKVSWEQMGAALLVHPAFQPAYLAVRSPKGDSFFEGTAMAGVGLAGSEHSTTNNRAGEAVRLLAARRTILGRTYVLLLGTDLQVPAAILRRLWLVMLLTLPPLLLVCGATGYWMSSRAMAPLRHIVATARSIDSRRLTQRVEVPRTRDEIQQLAETINGMLDRIERGFQRTRDFTVNASHELRTPLAIIRASAEVALLRQRAGEAFYRAALERILRESERNTRLLESMLELSRADSGVEAISVDTVSLAASVREACEQMAPLAAARGIVLHVQPGSEAKVLADRDQLHRLWLILLDNAVKYTPEGGSITVRARELSVEVEDTGIGIASEDLHLIFERFYRTDKARSRALGGAGLGLAIAREIALVHGAELAVDSTQGKGSRFSVTFPLHAAVQPEFSANFQVPLIPL
jgi:heavy metal sensor kinase